MCYKFAKIFGRFQKLREISLLRNLYMTPKKSTELLYEMAMHSETLFFLVQKSLTQTKSGADVMLKVFNLMYIKNIYTIISLSLYFSSSPKKDDSHKKILDTFDSLPIPVLILKYRHNLLWILLKHTLFPTLFDFFQ